MTTITNFVEGNFITNPEGNTAERPVWVLDGSTPHNIRAIVESFVSKCSSDKK